MKMFCLFFPIMLVTTFVAHAGIPKSNEQAVCLAVLPEDMTEETRATSDLLSTVLGARGDVILAERTEIARITDEQQLTTSLQTTDRTERMALGQLLRVDGMVFVKHDTDQHRLFMRLTDTRHGFQVAYFSYNTRTHTMEDRVRLMAEDIADSAVKLRIAPTDLQWVSIMRFANSTMISEYNWVEDRIPVLLNACLAKEPRILVLERRGIWELVEEGRHHAEIRQFAGSAVIIDGELAVTLGGEISVKDMPISLTLRIRDANLREFERVSVNGQLDNLETMTVDAVRELLLKLRTMEHHATTNASDLEADELLNIARRHRLVWAAESGHALVATNTALPVELVKTLLQKTGTGKSGRNIYGTRVSTSILEQLKERVYNLTRAANLCQDAGVPLIDYASGAVVDLLITPNVMLDAEMRRMLKPIRQSLRYQVENQHESSARHFENLIYWSPTFFDNPLDTFLYTRSLFDRLDVENIAARDRSECQIIMIHKCYWPPEQYESLLSHTNALIRYFANSKLARFNFGKKRKQYSQSALSELPGALTDEFGTGDIRRKMFSGNYFATSIAQLTNSIPEQRDQIYQAIFVKLDRDLREKAYRRIILFHPSKYLNQIGPERAIPWMDHFLAHSADISKAMGRNRVAVEHETKFIIEYRNSYPQFVKPGWVQTNIQSRVIVSSETPQWRDSFGTLWPNVLPTKHQSELLTPQRLLPDGDVVWVAMGGIGSSCMHKTGILKLEVNSGEILAGRYGLIKGAAGVSGTGTSRADGTENFMITVNSPFIWKDYVGFAQNGVGVLLFPRNMCSIKNNLDDVLVIDTPQSFGKNVKMAIPSDHKSQSRTEIKEALEHIKKVVPLDDAIYIALENVVLAWDMQHRQLRVVGDAQREIDGFAIPGKAAVIWDLLVDEATHRLHAVVGMMEQTTQWSQRGVGYNIWAYDPHDLSWTCVSNSPSTYSETSQNLKALPDNFIKTHHVCNYHNGTLAITGIARDWQLKYFTHGSNSTNVLIDPVGKHNKTAPPLATPMDTLLQAIKSGDLKQVKILASGLDLNECSREGVTPLRSAILSEQQAIVQWLLTQQVEIDDIGIKTGRTPLLLATQTGNMGIIRQLMDAGANPNATDKYGNTMFVIAARAPNSSVMKLLYERERPSTSVLNKALFHAVGWRQKRNVIWLIQHGANINFVMDRNGIFGDILIKHAARYSTPEIIQLLLESGADPNATRKNNITPLWCAEFFNRADNVRALLENGANLEHLVYDHKSVTINYYGHVFDNPEAVAMILDGYGKLIARKFGDD